MKTAFLILIGSVLIVGIVFGILIWRQTIKFEKKAFAAKMSLDKEIEELGLLEESKTPIDEF
ncbi:MAG TPA: hypothetical protein VFD02_04420, partial [Syntrophomonadaceae bacterium]|nr:hypothetical protein [Syntrophomonadaceae bacterium]